MSELAREHGLHPSSASRLLRTLANAGFVRLNPTTGRDRLGFSAPSWPGSCCTTSTCARRCSEMHALASRSQETVNLAVLDGAEAVVVEQALADSVFRYASRVGRRIPLHATAHGKALLAYSPAAPDRSAAGRNSGGRASGVVHPGDHHQPRRPRSVRQIVVQGYATAWGEMDSHLAGVAVPIFDHSREVVASLALPGSVERYTAEHIIRRGPRWRKRPAGASRPRWAGAPAPDRSRRGGSA